jgi:cytochrome c oxidase subunit 2
MTSPMGIMHTFAQKQNAVTQLGWGATILCIAVVIIIGVLLIGGLMRGRREELHAHDVVRSGSGMSWIYYGVGISTVALLALFFADMTTLVSSSYRHEKTALTIEIKAHQWWWEVRYIDGEHSSMFTTANEIHIPTGRPVAVQLESSDVIHSFWVPRLAGKMDVIPGQRNRLVIAADSAGTYRGQCAEYCGLQHAHMAMEVVAQSPQQFRAWWADQLSEAPVPNDSSAAQGLKVFREQCAACHTIRGTDALGIVGPDLTHVMSRATIAAGTLPNTRGYLAGWISDPQGVKPGARMPRLELSSDELQAVLAYLETLQ